MAQNIHSASSTAPSLQLGRGVNISHWLSQRNPEEPKPTAWFSELDAAFIKASGFDHIRLPVDEQVLWDDAGKRREQEWLRLHAALSWCQRQALRILVDLHVVRSHYFNAAFQGRENPLWKDESEQARLADLWRKLSGELKTYPVEAVGYEILNEPVSPDTETWNRILNRVHTAIREKEPDRTIVIGSNMWQKVHTVPELRLPADDPNIVVSFHYYEPGMITHYRSSWTALREYDGPVNYPGVPYPAECLPKEPSEDLRTLLEEGNRYYDRDVIRREVSAAVDHIRSLGLTPYCGEWGCLLLAPRAIRLAWCHDVASVLAELKVGWSIWDYKGGFALVDAKSLVPDHELIDLLTEQDGVRG